MKIWFEWSYSWLQEDFILGLTMSKHRHKKWKGYSLYFHFNKRCLILSWVNDYSAYTKIMEKYN